MCGTLDHCFIMTHSIHKEGDILQIYFVRYSAKQGTTHRPMSHLAHLYTVPFLCAWEEHRWQSSWVDFTGQCLWLLLLRLAAVVPLLLLPQNSLLTSLAFAPDSEVMQATRIFLMASCWSFIWFFRPLLDTHNRLPCLGYYVWLGISFSNVISVSLCQWDMNVFYSDRKTYLKLRCDSSMNSSCSGVPRTF